MYCGDETGAFVGDCGHATSRFGYGGEDTPKVSEEEVDGSWVGDLLDFIFCWMTAHWILGIVMNCPVF